MGTLVAFAEPLLPRVWTLWHLFWVWVDWLEELFYWFKAFLPPANEVWGKVIFLHLFVILFTGGACMVAPGGMCGCSWGGMHGCSQGGVHGCSRGGGMCGCSGGHAWLLWGGGACVGYDEIRRYDQWAGGTHPTGMHSCLLYNTKNVFFTWGEIQPIQGQTEHLSNAP